MARDVVRQGRVALVVAAAACGSAQPATSSTSQTLATGGVPAWDRGTIHVTGAPPIDQAVAAALEPYAAITPSKLLDISDDGTQLLVLQGGDAMLVGAPLAQPIARTSDIDVSWARFGERGTIDYAGDRNGTEADRLFQIGAKGPAKSLTGGSPSACPPARARHSPDTDPDPNAACLAGGRRVADPIERNGRLIWAEPTETATTLWLLDNGTPRKVYTDDGAWAVIDLSSDGTQMLARKTVSLESSTLYRIDIAEGHAVALTSVDPRVAAPSGAFGLHGQLFAIASAGARNNLWELLPRGQRLIAPELSWDVTQLAVSPDGTTVAFVVDEDGASQLYLYDTAAHTHRLAPDAPTGGVISELRYAAKANVLAFSFSDARHPKDAFTYDPSDGRTTRWTRVELGGIGDGAFVAADHVRVPAGDIAVPALVWRPRGGGKHRVLVELHGGPEDQWLPRWSPFEQFLASRGIAIVQPNVRGSVGYGRDYAALDDGVHREDAVRDVGAVLAWIAQQPDLDAHDVSVMGTSYGGYLALAALVAYPEQLRAGIDVSGIADFVAFLEGTAPYRRASRRVEYGDERDPTTRARLQRISPLARAGAIKAPLIVAVGRKDPRVPPAVADKLVAAVRQAGGSVWYVAADDEGHGFTKPDSQAVLQALIAQLLAR